VKISEVTSTTQPTVRQLLKKYFNIKGLISIEEDNLVNVMGTVETKDGVSLDKLPVNFNKVSKSCWFGRAGLTTCEGFPKIVDGGMSCYGNKLTTLKGCTKSICNDFNCNNNQLASLEGGPEYVGGNFSCSRNNLTSLVGGPTTVKGDYYCCYNPLTSLEGLPSDGSVETLIITYSPNLPLMRALAVNNIRFYSGDTTSNKIRDVLNKYAGQGKAGMMKCSSELLTLGKELGLDLRQNARW